MNVGWAYRAVNNPVARKKWLAFGFFLFILAIVLGAYKYATTGNLGKVLIATTTFVLVVVLYTLVMLGKVRYYYIDDTKIRYKPFKTNLDNIEGFEVDEKNKIIRLRLKKPSLLSVRTLYFEREEDMEEVERLLEKHS
jgi:hypothetical protein